MTQRLTSAQIFQEAVGLLKAMNRPVAVLGHLRPDGDCIGAQIALCRYLRLLGIEAVCVNTHAIPRNLQGLVADTPFVTGKEWTPQNHVGVAVDCSDHARMGDRLKELMPEIFLCIDHHRSNPGFAAFDIVERESSATCEILSELLLPIKNAVDAVSAQALYVGIATDTGQFQYPSTTARVFELACELNKRGANPAQAAQELYEQERFGKIQLLERFLHTLSLRFDGQLCVGTLTQEDYDRTNSAREDSEGFVNYPRSLQGVKIAAVLEESGGMVKGSLRARDPLYCVDKLAANFGGGGHAAAAGFTVEGATLETFYPLFLKTAQAHLSQYCS